MGYPTLTLSSVGAQCLRYKTQMTLEKHIGDIRNQLKEGAYINEIDISNRILMRLLKKLGWPISDAWTVIFEYAVSNKKIDLVLCKERATPIIFIEIKMFERLLDNSEKKKAKKQLFQYIFQFQNNSNEEIPIAILTDGQKWLFFHPTQEKKWIENPTRELDLIENEIEESAYYLNRYLNYQSICNGKAIEAIKGDTPTQEDRTTFSRRLRVTMPNGDVIDCPNPKDTFNKVIERLEVKDEELTFKKEQQHLIWEIRKNLIRIGRMKCVPLKVERLKSTEK